MRLNINLATQPYEDARRFVTIWGSVLGGLLLLLITLSIFLYRGYRDYRETNASIERERQVLADFEQKQQQGLAILNQPQNQDVREKSDFLNGLIRRKEVSWTRIFSDLEKLMPGHLRVLAIEPRVEEDKIKVNMQIGGDSREKAAELIRNMERSHVFRSAQIVVETDGQPGPGQPDAMRFQVEAEYVPTENMATPNADKAEQGDKTEGGQ